MGDEEGMTPLFLAINNNNMELIMVFMEISGQLDLINSKRETALLYAVRLKRVECVVVLLKFGASVYVSDKDNNTPFHWAARTRAPLVMAMLLKGKESAENDEETIATYSKVQSGVFSTFLNKVISKLQISINEANAAG